MTLNESIVEEAAFGWHPASCKALPTTLAISATVQSRSWLNL
jgi:hypothetical protein